MGGPEEKLPTLHARQERLHLADIHRSATGTGDTLGNPFLILIAVFVWIGAGAEAGAAEDDARLSGRPAGRAIITDFQVAHPGDPLARAVELTLSGSQKDFPVVEDGAVVGVLSGAASESALRPLHNPGHQPG